ncbi:MAG: glucose-6-phosphate isomerase [Bacteroidetes bacterium]|nr:glucose-6-phosphate isomerase [Bacteroidota bacterium]MCL2303183.1 glucose-6-phosphate isomerase [Lentimicrobiaceae bacterium]
MITTKLHTQDAQAFLPLVTTTSDVEKAYQELISKTGKGNDFLGWIDLPEEITPSLFAELNHTAKELAAQSEVIVVVGIGGSYLGARAVIEALQHPFKALLPHEKTPLILFAGNSMGEDYHKALMDVLDIKDYAVIVISKSGTTTEPAIAFRILKEHCEKKYGKTSAQKRIVAITDEKKGALKKLATEENYQTFIIPDDVGGRYSVLTPVGLLPIACAGFNIEKLVNGAKKMRDNLIQHQAFDKNIAMQYALLRYLLYREGKKLELVVAYEPQLFFFIEWFKQLFGESDGKEGKGIFPAGAIFSTDLHSLGQYIQEGERNMFETVLSVEKADCHLPIPFDNNDLDGLNYLQQKTIHEINLTAEEGTRLAHISGNVPNIRIAIPNISEETLGELIYFFEFSCALGGYMLNVNPFDQPGVEAYKTNMFRLLGR